MEWLPLLQVRDERWSSVQSLQKGELLHMGRRRSWPQTPGQVAQAAIALLKHEAAVEE